MHFLTPQDDKARLRFYVFVLIVIQCGALDAQDAQEVLVR